MKKQIKQVYWDPANETKSNTTPEELISGSAFDFANSSIIQLGIQTLPGTEVFLNKSVEPIIIGSTGIYELDLGSDAIITSIEISEESLKFLGDFDEEGNLKIRRGDIIIDVAYEVEEEDDD